MKKLLFIVNPKAGKTKSNAPLFDAVAAFSRAGYLVRVFLTEAGGEARTYAAKWGPQYDVVVCAGGDGTLNETISGLMELERRPLLGYLPNGSTNDFAASLHLSSDPRHAAQAIASGQPHALASSILTRLGSNFTSPPREVLLHTAPKMKSPSNVSPSASMRQL